MQQEYETQVLDIDQKAIISKLRSLGAREEPEVLQRRWVYDIDPCTASSTGEWVRLRQVGNRKPTITYKNKSGKELCDTKEIEVEVDDFEKTAAILSKLKPEGRYYQENKRHKFVLRQIEFTLDSWPMIPTYLEIEGKNEDKVHEGLRILGLTDMDSGHIGTIAIYKKYRIDLHSMDKLIFKDNYEK